MPSGPGQRAAAQQRAAADRAGRPADVRYAASTLGDGVTLIALLQLEPGQEHPLRTFPPYAELSPALNEVNLGFHHARAT